MPFESVKTREVSVVKWKKSLRSAGVLTLARRNGKSFNFPFRGIEWKGKFSIAPFDCEGSTAEGALLCILRVVAPALPFVGTSALSK